MVHAVHDGSMSHDFLLILQLHQFNMSELHEAASTGDLQTLEDQLKKGLDPNEPDPEYGGRTPLHIACSRGHKKCVHVLLTAGAKVNAVTDIGWTPAHCACETGQVQLALKY